MTAARTVLYYDAGDIITYLLEKLLRSFNLTSQGYSQALISIAADAYRIVIVDLYVTETR